MRVIGIFVIAILLTACNAKVNRKQRDENDMMLYLPYYSTVNKNIRLVHYTNAECLKCIEILEHWKEFIEYNNIDLNPNIDLLFYVYSTNYKFFEHINHAKLDFPVPFIHDSLNSFYKNNKLSENVYYHTFLIDGENRIILSGDPFEDENLEKLYIEKVKNLTKSDEY